MLRHDIESLLSDERFVSSHIGILIESLDRNEILYRKNDTKRFVPASVLKLFTSAVAMAGLGPDFRYETDLIINGSIEAGVLNGDIVVVGRGDPTIKSGMSEGANNDLFAHWANLLELRAVKRINGNILIDNGYLDALPMGYGWSWDDEEYCFSARRDAFSVNNNCLGIIVYPGSKVREYARIETLPRTGYMEIVNNVITNDKDGETTIQIKKTKRLDGVKVSGIIPINTGSYKRFIAVDHPAEYGGCLLKETLTKKRIYVKGEVLTGKNVAPTTGKFQVVHVYRSEPLKDIVAELNKGSNNLYAEQLFLTIGKELKGRGDDVGAQKAVTDFLTESGMDMKGLNMVDGSGLSRYNLVSPKQIVALLGLMFRQRCFEAFYQSLPGEEDRLNARIKCSECGSKLRAKTGSMQYIRNMAGYVTTKDGEMLCFSFMCNYYDTPKGVIEELYGKLCERLVNFSRQ